MMNEFERAELEAEHDGYTNDYQRAMAVSSMRRAPDDRGRAKALAADGKYVAVLFSPEYCPITDGILGERCHILGVCDTRDEAWAIIFSKPESTWDDCNAEVWPRPPVESTPQPVSEDDLPF